MTRIVLFVGLILGCWQFLFGAGGPTGKNSANIYFTANPPAIDGEINEREWGNSHLFQNFWDHWPNDDQLAEYQTRVKLTYDNEYLYVAAELEDDHEENIIQTLKRDSEHDFWRSDGFAVVLDPQNNQSNGYIFGVNAAGAQIDGLLSAESGRTNTDLNWNNAWISEVKKTEKGWNVEMAIPFKSIKYGKKSEWGINFMRNDMKRNVYSTWTRIPLNFQGIDLGRMGTVRLSDIPENQGGKVFLMPSTISGMNRDFEAGMGNEWNANMGLDAKIAVSNALNLDVTVNPDFSQVEVDRQVTNLSRFSIYFPEKRSFFLENSDLFSNLGVHEARPIFTRNIGYKDGETVPILLGARLSGNVTENFRMGLMNVQTGTKSGMSSENFSIAAVQQRVLKRSVLKGFFVNRQGTGNGSFQPDEFNRVAGVEFDYLSEDGKWRGKSLYHKSFNPENFNQSTFLNAGISYNSREYYASLYFYDLGRNYLTEVGFTPRIYNYDASRDTIIRRGYKEIYARGGYKLYSKSSQISNHHIDVYSRTYFNQNGSLNERDLKLSYYLNFKDMSRIDARLANMQINLPYSTYLISADKPLPATGYNYSSVMLGYRTPTQYEFYGSLMGEYGGFFNGTKLTLGTELNYRTQPWGNFGINYRFNNVELAPGYGVQDIHLIGTRAEIAFSKAMFLTSFLQYNTQIENFNINVRFQWRYRTMSDIYLVVTNNYNSYDFTQRDFGVILKLNYWLNV
jgi:hypothetical protein